MDDVGDGGEVREVQSVYDPVLVVAIAQEDLPGRGVEAAALGLGGHQRAEAVESRRVATQVRKTRSAATRGSLGGRLTISTAADSGRPCGDASSSAGFAGWNEKFLGFFLVAAPLREKKVCSHWEQ